MARKILATELTGVDGMVFVSVFYGLWAEAGFGKPDDGSPRPWGMPWLHGSPVELEGDSPADMARNYFDDCRQDIGDIIAAEREAE